MVLFQSQGLKIALFLDSFIYSLNVHADNLPVLIAACLLSIVRLAYVRLNNL